jgi:hypothetical protein
MHGDEIIGIEPSQSNHGVYLSAEHSANQSYCRVL